MPIPSISELELAASEIVWNARKKGNLKEYTPRLIRTTLEDQFHLDQGTLDAAEYKFSIKAATRAALREDPPPGVGEKSPRAEKQSPSVLKKKRKSDGTVKADDDENPKSAAGPSHKGKGKAKMAKKNEDVDEGNPKKRRKTVPQKKKVVSDDDDDNASSSRPKQREPQKEKQFKSLEHVPTSDMEQDEPDPEPTLNVEIRKDSTSSAKVTSNRPAPPKKDITPKESKGKEPVRVPQNEDLPTNDSGAKSESELSVLIDDPPQRRKSKSKSEGKEAKKPRVKKEAPMLSKEEERIKRLKSYIVACGVRKVWSKLFQGLDTPQQQIKKLEENLAELGMRGRMTMDQAKAIKQKRELAKELEDVQEFAKALEAKGSAGQKDIKALRQIESGGSEDEKAESNDDDEESDVAPKKRSMNARKSISAFLKDQSSDDE